MVAYVPRDNRSEFYYREQGSVRDVIGSLPYRVVKAVRLNENSVALVRDVGGFELIGYFVSQSPHSVTSH